MRKVMKSWWAVLVVVAFVMPWSIQLLRRTVPEMAAMAQDQVLQYHHGAVTLVVRHPYVAVTVAMTLLMMASRRGRRSIRPLVRHVGHYLYEWTYHNAAQRDGRAYGLWWLGHSIGLVYLVYLIFHPSIMGVLCLETWWILLWLWQFVFRRYRRWQSSKFRLPGRFRWSGILQELKDALDPLGLSSRRGGRGQK